jgi:hypothetical protein
VDLSEGMPSGEPLKGSGEVRQMALATLVALERADLADAAQVLYERVFSQRAEALLEPYEDNDGWCWRFRPMAELLLLESTCLADAADLSADDRRARFEWAIEMAGF